MESTVLDTAEEISFMPPRTPENILRPRFLNSSKAAREEKKRVKKEISARTIKT
jgi:hypothetical protein